MFLGAAEGDVLESRGCLTVFVLMVLANLGTEADHIAVEPVFDGNTIS